MTKRTASIALVVAFASASVVNGVLRPSREARAESAATTWLFAEGNTLPGWYEFLVLINPDPVRDITVTIEYQLEEPAGVLKPGKSQIVQVLGGMRRTIAVYDVLGRTSIGTVYTGVSARLTSTDAFIAERPMYFINDFDVGVVNGAHDALGVNAPSRTWYFAEGSTLVEAEGPGPAVEGMPGQYRGFIPYFTMQNVSGGTATVDITYFTNNPDRQVRRRITLPTDARVTTDITNVYDNPAYPGSLGPDYEGFGTEISSDREIVVERPFYSTRDFGDIGLVNAASDERGATDANKTTLLFAEGTVLDDFFEFITIFNPNMTGANLDVVYYVEGLTAPVKKTISVGPQARKTIQVYNELSDGGLGRGIPNAAAPGSAGVSVKLESTNGVGFLAERPLYFIHDFGNGLVNGSHDVLGAATPDASWFFAEGTTRPGFFEFVTIQNPNPAPIVARLDYLVDDQLPVTTTRDVPANSRTTIPVAGSARGSIGLPSEADFGLRVTSVVSDNIDAVSTAPIVVERPIYVNAFIADSSPRINDGHDTLGFELQMPPPLPATPVLAVSKQDAPDPVQAGQELTYTITLTNTAGVTATAVSITDALPAGTTFVRASEGATTATAPARIGFEIDKMAVGEVASRTITLAPLAPGSLTNTVEALSRNGGSALDTEATQVGEPPAPQADLVITKTAPPSVGPGTLLTYTITVTNTGPSSADGIGVTDTLPTELSPSMVSATPSQGTCEESPDASGTLTCNLGALAEAGVATVTIVVTTGSCGGTTFVNRSGARAASPPDPTPVNYAEATTTC